MKLIELGGKVFNLGVLDTAANAPENLEKNALFFKHANAYLGVYDVANAESFRELPRYLDHALGLNELPVVIVGAKNDLPKEVPSYAGRILAASYGGIFLETSSKTDNSTLLWELAISCCFLPPLALPPLHTPAADKKRCTVM